MIKTCINIIIHKRSFVLRNIVGRFFAALEAAYRLLVVSQEYNY